MQVDVVEFLVLWTWASFSVVLEVLCAIYFCLRLKYAIHDCKCRRKNKVLREKKKKEVSFKNRKEM